MTAPEQEAMRRAYEYLSKQDAPEAKKIADQLLRVLASGRDQSAASQATPDRAEPDRGSPSP